MQKPQLLSSQLRSPTPKTHSLSSPSWTSTPHSSSMSRAYPIYEQYHQQQKTVDHGKISTMTLPQIPSSMETWRQWLSQQDIVILYIWKESCLPCHKSMEELEWMAEYYASKERNLPSTLKLCFVKDQIDTEYVQDVSSPSYVHWRMCEAVPFFLIYVQNQIQYQLTGFQRKELLDCIEHSITEVLQSDEFQQRVSLSHHLPEKMEIIEESPNIVYHTYG